MLATTSYSNHYQPRFLPTIPSPLSPRTSSKPTHIPFSQRPVKKAPSPGRDALKERRRNMFLKKVKEGREDKRFEARGEDIQRLDFMHHQKQWAAEQARSAPLIPSDPPEEDDDQDYDFSQPNNFPQSSDAMQFSAPSTQFPVAEEEFEQVLQREHEELEALLSFLPGEEGHPTSLAQPQQMDETDDLASEHFGSDDDYEALFSDFVDENAHQSGEAMDMDMS